MARLEGSGASRLVKLIQMHGKNDSISICLATITAAPPSIKLKVDGDKFELESDDFEVAEHLTKHTRQVKIAGGATQSLAFQDELKVGDRVIVLSYNNDQRYFVMDRIVSYYVET
ncbi:DUF2577 domain-containing protein [Bacillus sp. AFS041924]|uniref:DUF2577 domain-containing protein n=1 Tax=Bacillus sp. AFS041924 TaxID=2033503 RepID=UPI000BFCDE79|nr:DUF2577 domain-containing protein [Bacillus sp. AFS041924]PGS55096.1 hypothetical protein COC46_04010 [Bacillus sp. AFS041924]